MKIEEDEAWVETCQFEPSGSDFEDHLDKPCGSFCGPCGPVPSASSGSCGSCGPDTTHDAIIAKLLNEAEVNSEATRAMQMKMDEELAKRLESSDDISTIAISLSNEVSAIDLLCHFRGNDSCSESD